MATARIPTTRRPGQRHGERHQVTPARRAKVTALAGYGIPQADVARLLDTDPETLRRYYRSELDVGTAKANAKVAESLYRLATDGGNVTAAIFWLKCRAGWYEHSAELAELQAKLDALLAELDAGKLAARTGRTTPGALHWTPDAVALRSV